MAYWSDDGKNNFVVMQTATTRDCWIMSLNLATRDLTLWTGRGTKPGLVPGIGYFFSGATPDGWPTKTRLKFQSEETGYSHLYTVDIDNGKEAKHNLGKTQVQTAQLSNDKSISTLPPMKSIPGEALYKILVNGGRPCGSPPPQGRTRWCCRPMKNGWLICTLTTTSHGNCTFPKNDGRQSLSQSPLTSTEFNSYPWRGQGDHL